MSDEQVSTKAPVKAMWTAMIAAWAFFLLRSPGLGRGTFIAVPLNVVAFILAIVCLARGKVAQGVFGLIGTLGISWMFHAVGTIGY